MSPAAAVPPTTSHKHTHSKISSDKTKGKRLQPNGLPAVVQQKTPKILDLTGQDSITVDDDFFPTLHDFFSETRPEVQNNAAPMISDSSTMQTRSTTRVM